MNTVNLVGRLTKDVELKYSPSGVAMTTFTLAVNRAFTNQQGEREADFIQCKAFKKQAENLANFMRKGSQIGVVGRIQTGSYEGQDGKRVYTTDVICDNITFLDSKASGENAPQQNTNNGAYNQQQNAPQQQYQQPPQYQQQNNPYSGMNMNGVPANQTAHNVGGPVEVSSDDLPF